MAPVLEIENLHTNIKLRQGTVHPVDGVNLYVDPGETLGIVGESGCGKTMTALSIMGLLPVGGSIAEGKIFLDGRQISDLSEDQMRRVRGNDVGMIFQDPLTSLNPTMTVGKQIAEAVLLHRHVSKEQAMDRAAEVLDLVGLPKPRERLNEYPHQFSGGMRQRVMIAMALACEPKLLIADEPTTALDVTIQKQILELIDDLRQRLQMSVVLVTHDLGVIAGRANRVAVMYAGKIVETTDTRTLFANPRHPYTEALFQALPDKAAETRERLYSIPGAPPDLMNPPKGCRFAARCRYAADRCRDEEPILLGETPDHRYACFFPVGESERGTRASQLADAQPPSPPEEEFAPVADEVVLSTKDLVKDFPVTAGVMQRRIGSVSAVAGVTFDI
ncbi:MAG TPA: ABC transporter ATP-binding protein, partial [Streptosporangiaceae bacterium]